MERRRMSVIRILMIFIPALLLMTGCVARTSKIDSPDSVADLTAVEIGGLDQWILVRGEDKSNPVLLWLHGGPGAAQMPVHRAFNKELEKEFVVVHWDQRGAGKSNHRGFREETMTMDRFIDDVAEMTRYLKDRFDQERIFLLGHSWGTQPGILIVQRYPEDYHAYISVGQVVHPQQADTLSYRWLKKQVEQNGTRRQKKRFENLGPPPFEEHDRYVAFAKMKDSFGGSMDLDMGRLAWISFGAKEYTPGDYVKWLRGANRGSGPMWEESRKFDLSRDVPILDLPVWFIAGRNDYNTPAELIKEYAELLDAPHGKQFIIMEGTAHAPFMGDPHRFNRIVSDIKNECSKQNR